MAFNEGVRNQPDVLPTSIDSGKRNTGNYSEPEKTGLRALLRDLDKFFAGAAAVYVCIAIAGVGARFAFGNIVQDFTGAAVSLGMAGLSALASVGSAAKFH